MGETMSKRETVWGTRWMYGILACLGLTSVSMSVHADDTTLWLKTVQSAGAPSGLCVQLGAREVAGPAALARSGRFLVQVLERDRSAREASRKSLEGSGLYGLVSVDEWREADRLPYTENLIDLLIVTDPAAKALSGKEILRVLCPNGVVMAAPQTLGKRALQSAGFADIQSLRVAGTTWTAARKPWPSEMDEWTHPRHSASGNAVSRDLLVGPPRRVRWVVNAPDEVRGLVTAKGRNIYGAALARNGFNGLRLWARDLIRPATKGSFVLRNLPRGMPYPIIVGDRVYAVAKDTLVALDASTGRTVQSYPDAGHPRELLCDGGLLIVADAMSVRALEAESGRLVWTVRIANPRNVVAGDGYVAFTAGQPNRGQKPELVTLNRGDGSVRWRRNDLDWAGEVDRIVYHRGLLAYECSTFNDFSPGNATRVLAAEDGRVLWEREYPPGMNHMRQARALFIGDRLWILHGGKVHDPSKPRYDKFERLPVQCRALDPQTGKELTTFPAGLTHCFPPVATPRYLFAGEMNLTDLVTGRIEANHITKAACGRDFGWVPANGLIYVTPKHCVCWPMLRGYAALAPERPAGSVHDWNVDQIDFILERGTAVPKEDTQESAADWPIYRHDPWRSASTATAIPSTLRTLWSVHAGSWPQAGPIVEDWRENPFTKGPVTAPVVAGGRVYVAQPDAHRVSAFDTDSGRLLWQFTANGRVDTAPTIHRGLCLFGTNLGWVYCVDAATGRLVWRLRAAPVDERIVAYGQVESPWPVPGSVLVVGGTAYFAAGRQPLADGGILVFAVDPRTGQRRW
ncbi:MAG TPA: hypothetical protein EYP14_04165, partial [Planctomycetaceae bacterium]|nr:hypothetical protein [Planctomycetaceae bacterium]